MHNTPHDMVFKKLTVTIPEDVLKKLEKIAKEESRSKSNMVRRMIEQYCTEK